ncbi:MAG: 1-deoxy-D-xylulose-5-phosphate synthase, partial [Bacteroidales bacterium]|nr:1-deoxy-D-xylulose-5-phosphate synthase [Bacteroidales bacterium]
MYKILDSINSPEDVKALQKRDLAVLCDELRQYIIECCATNPGHLGSSLGAVEIAVALHRVFDTPADKIVWDVGHQAYAHKIITGRREEFRNQRRKGGICGFPKMNESPYDAFGVGHASTSISAALGMAVADNLSGRSAHHIAVIGDGALTGGLAFEGINNAGSLRSNLLVILNDNRMSIDAPTGGLHKHLLYITTSAKYNRIKNGIWHKVGDGLRSLGRAVTKGLKRVILRSNTTASEAVSMFESLGFRYFGPTDGNNIDTLIPVLERLRNIDGPKLLHLVTVKGKGYAPAEANPSGWHAPGKFTPDTGEKKPSGGIIDKYQVVFGETITELARADSRIVAITPAMLQGSSL